MSEANIPISDAALVKLRELSEWSGRSIAEELEHAVGAYHDQQFWVAVNTGYAQMRGDTTEWAAEQAERRLWENTLMDGLDPSERWGKDDGLQPPSNEEKAG